MKGRIEAASNKCCAGCDAPCLNSEGGGVRYWMGKWEREGVVALASRTGYCGGNTCDAGPELHVLEQEFFVLSRFSLTELTLRISISLNIV